MNLIFGEADLRPLARTDAVADAKGKHHRKLTRCKRKKGVCEYHWTVILNQGSGGRGQSDFGFV